ncbi:UNVERIFIED_ORG: hypothetical protein GGR78_003595 [Xanthomonas campestris]
MSQGGKSEEGDDESPPSDKKGGTSRSSGDLTGKVKTYSGSHILEDGPDAPPFWDPDFEGITDPDFDFPEHDDLAVMESKFRGKGEFELNSQTHRWLRVAAFVIFSLVTLAYLIAMLVGLIRFAAGDYLVAILGAPKAEVWTWHVLVLIGFVFSIFAAIPLTLAASLFKMISDNDKSDNSGDLKTASSELGKVIFDALRALVSKIGPDGK